MLLNLKTDLKSLKYGKDRFGGGDSGQPYIQSDINSNPQTVRVNDDGRIRGGARGAGNASTTDLLRIKRFINSKPKGNLFLTNQIGLQFSNPRLERRQFRVDRSTQGQGFFTNAGNFIINTINRVANEIGPTRIYNLGINTLAQVPVNAFGQHFNRHGLLPAQDDNTKYFAVVINNNENGNNRLESLQTKFQLGVKYSNTNFINTPLITGTQRLLRTLDPIARSIGGLIGGRVGRTISNVSRLSTLFFNNNDLVIDNYLGGPGSTYGVGKTLIRRYDITEKGEVIDSAFEKSRLVAKSAKINWNLALGGAYPFSNPNSNSPTNLVISLDNTININDFKNVENQNVIKELNAISPAAKTYNQLKSSLDKITKIKQEIPFSAVPSSNYNGSNYGPFKEKFFETKPNNINRTSPNFKYYGTGSVSLDGSQRVYNNSNTHTRIDSDILTNVFTIIDPFSGNEDKIFLSSYMKGFKEDFTATWNDVNYAGRAESFYVYNKFKRTVSFNLQIPCFNRKELFEKHRALGQLAATTAGSYNNGFLGGVLIKLNIGNYIVGEYSILNSLNYSIPDDTSWDITPEGRLAMLIDTSFQFTIIHQKLPEYKPTIPQKDPGKGFFNYLPDLVSGYLEKGNRTQTEQRKINLNFANSEYITNTKPSPVIRGLTRNQLDNIEFQRQRDILSLPNSTETPNIEEISINNNFIGPLQ
jgi:hypothetical protein